MEYKALYRKYRPNIFSDVVGQNSIIKTLKNSIIENKISHAYLFCGPRGSGKTSVAKILSKTVNCIKNNKGEKCQKCEICLQSEEQFLNDIIEIDAASNNGVDEIRELRNKVNLLPSICKYKVYIIDEVHMLTISAFNALLKTLEEPPKHVIFILATTEPHKLPQTIISRCQRFDFKKIDEKDIECKINEISRKEQITITESSIKLIAKTSDGSLRDAIGILDQLIVYKDSKIEEKDVSEIIGLLPKNEIVEFINDIFDSNYEKVLYKINKFDINGNNFKKIVEEMMICLKDIMISELAPKFYKENKEKIDIKNINIERIHNLLFILNDLNVKLFTSEYQKLLFEIEILNYISKNEKIFIEKKDLNKEQLIEMAPEIRNNNEIKKTKKVSKRTEFITDINKINELYSLRINNCFATASKKTLTNLQEKWTKLNNYIIDDKTVGLLSDGQIKAAGGTNIIITFPYKTAVERANKKLLEIEEILKKVLKNEYKPVIITDKEWEKEKEKFIENSKKNIKYKYLNEEIEYKVEKEIDEKKENMDLKFLEDIMEIE